MAHSTSLMSLGVRSRDGTKIVGIGDTETLNSLYSKVSVLFNLEDNKWSLCLDQKCKKTIPISDQPISSLHLKNGSMIYLNMPSKVPVLNSEEDDIDKALEKVDISHLNASKTTSECNHSTSSRCLKCIPADPFDEEYLRTRDPPIKHLPFHAYIRKLKGNSSEKFVALEEISCKIAKGCNNHPPWPRGICSRCQPSGIMLHRQSYRHVDNVMFENATIAEQFLDYWRKSGAQRIGFLLGTYEQYDSIPLGIRAVVKAIYEPPQVSDRDTVELLEDHKEELVDLIAEKLGIRRVGWIFTDLLPSESKEGQVACIRGEKDSHFLSAQECIMAATFQQKYPNRCKLTKSGFYGSKFVTVIVTGDKENNIHFEGYQVSNQCSALVRENCLVPTIDVPELACLKESSSKQYVPDVFYKEKDQFGNEITKLARPLPVEYLLVDVPTAFAVEQSHSFPGTRMQFPIENRGTIHTLQTLECLSKYVSCFDSSEYLTMFSNFHFLLFLASNEWVPLLDYMGKLFDAVRNQDQKQVEEWCAQTDNWNTLLEIAHLSVQTSDWACRRCTYHNQQSDTTCKICDEPRDEPME